MTLCMKCCCICRLRVESCTLCCFDPVRESLIAGTCFFPLNTHPALSCFLLAITALFLAIHCVSVGVSALGHLQGLTRLGLPGCSKVTSQVPRSSSSALVSDSNSWSPSLSFLASLLSLSIGLPVVCVCVCVCVCIYLPCGGR